MKVFFTTIFATLALTSCKTEIKVEDSSTPISAKVETKAPQQLKKAIPLSQAFKDYWYSGKAEISSYQLEQFRYGEKRQGEAFLIFVTEPFLKDVQVKANRKSAETQDVLKLNSTKNFITGIYPYSVMESVFYPVSSNQHAIKATASVQEWCGQAYAQLNNREAFEVKAHSYFENEADEAYNINKAVLENEIWTQLRINPKQLPQGEFKSVPSLAFARLFHKSIKPYAAKGELTTNSYTLSYPELNRTLRISFEENFPHRILSWEDTYKGKTSKATLKKTITSAYWNKNSNKDRVLRQNLQLQ